MPTLVYLHGLNSGPQSTKGQLLASAAAALPVAPRFWLPQLHHRPALALQSVHEWVAAHVPPGEVPTFIGSSLGGFYATSLAEHYGARAVVINPAIRPFASLASFLGPQQNLYSGEAYELTREHLDELVALRVERITRPERYYLLVRTGDELLDWRESVAYYAGAWQYVGGGGDHGWTDFAPMVASVLRFAGCGAACA